MISPSSRPLSPGVLSRPPGLSAVRRGFIRGVGMAGRADLHGAGSSALRALRKAAVDAHVQEHGPWCPGYNVPAHTSTDLCADHVVSVALGGDVGGPFAVLCRSCNARKGKGGHALIRTPALRSQAWL